MLPLQAQVASRPLLHVVKKREQQKGVAVLSLRVVVHQHIFVLFMCAVLNCFFLSSKLFTCFFFFVLYQLWCIVNFLVDFGFMFTRFRFSLLCNRLISLFITKKLVRGMFQISSDAKTKITRMLSSLSLFFYRQLSL